MRWSVQQDKNSYNLICKVFGHFRKRVFTVGPWNTGISEVLSNMCKLLPLGAIFSNPCWPPMMPKFSQKSVFVYFVKDSLMIHTNLFWARWNNTVLQEVWRMLALFSNRAKISLTRGFPFFCKKVSPEFTWDLFLSSSKVLLVVCGIWVHGAPWAQDKRDQIFPGHIVETIGLMSMIRKPYESHLAAMDAHWLGYFTLGTPSVNIELIFIFIMY